MSHPAYVASLPSVDECGNAAAGVPSEDASRARLTGLEEDIFQLREECALGLSLALDKQPLAAATYGRHNCARQCISPGVTAERRVLKRHGRRVLENREKLRAQYPPSGRRLVPGIRRSEAAADHLAVVIQSFAVLMSNDGNVAAHCDAKVVDVDMAEQSGSERFELSQDVRLAADDVVFVDLECGGIEHLVPDGDIAGRDGIEQHLRVSPEFGAKRGPLWARGLGRVCSGDLAAQRHSIPMASSKRAAPTFGLLNDVRLCISILLDPSARASILRFNGARRFADHPGDADTACEVVFLFDERAVFELGSLQGIIADIRAHPVFGKAFR